MNAVEVLAAAAQTTRVPEKVRLKLLEEALHVVGLTMVMPSDQETE